MTETIDQPSKTSFLRIFSRFILVLFISLLSIIVYMFEDIFLQEPIQKSSIGIVKVKDGNVRIKRAGSSDWRNLQKGDFIHSKSLVFTSKDSRATYILIDGTIIDQDPETLLKLHFKIKENRNIEEEFKTLESIDINITKGSVNITTSPPEGVQSDKSLNLNKNTFKVKGDNSLIKVDKTKEKDNYSLAVVRGEVDFIREGTDHIALGRGEQLKNLSDDSASDQSNTAPKKEKVPEELLSQYEKDAKDNIDNEDMQKEFLEGRSITRILQRIFDGIFN